MAVLAKMHVTERTENAGQQYPPEHYQDEHWFQKSEDGSLIQDRECCERTPGVQSVTVILRAVYSTEEGHENHAFWDATPSGDMTLTIENPEAAKYFETGQEYYVEIRKARK